LGQRKLLKGDFDLALDLDLPLRSLLETLPERGAARARTKIRYGSCKSEKIKTRIKIRLLQMQTKLGESCAQVFVHAVKRISEFWISDKASRI
jgi:hypothetical protein